MCRHRLLSVLHLLLHGLDEPAEGFVLFSIFFIRHAVEVGLLLVLEITCVALFAQIAALDGGSRSWTTKAMPARPLHSSFLTRGTNFYSCLRDFMHDFPKIMHEVAFSSLKAGLRARLLGARPNPMPGLAKNEFTEMRKEEGTG